MRGSDERSGSLFSYVSLEARVRGDHPLRTIRAWGPTRAAAVRKSAADDKLILELRSLGYLR